MKAIKFSIFPFLFGVYNMPKSIRTTNNNVPSYWVNNTAAHSNNKQFTTDGQNLYSYNLRIGATIDGQKILFAYSAPAGHMVSCTTSQHVGKARRWADQIMGVDVARHAGVIR